MQIDQSRRYRVLNPRESYSFAEFFKFPFEAEDVLSDPDCTLERRKLTLAKAEVDIEVLNGLRNYLSETLEIANPVTEIARREFLIAPIVREVCRQTGARVSSEYAIRANEWLKGTLDYYIRSAAGFVVIKAKQSDLTHGFVQLAAELIALNIRVDSSTSILYGAVTSGDLWKFAEFHPQERKVIEDRNVYQVPRDLDDLLRILVAIVF